MKTTAEVVNQLFHNKQLRKEVLGKDILLFMSFYFTDYLQYPTAPFQKEILSLVQNLDHKFLEIIAFRGSAKSTYCSLVLPIFSVVGLHKKKHILLVCQNQAKAEQMLMNIRLIWDSSELLMKDFGPIRRETDPWNQTSLVFGHYGAKITAVSVEKSPRGIIHGRYRPDLIICDDIEDVASAKTLESRDKTWQFINAELIPAGDLNTSYIFIGNLVHEDSVMMRLKKWLNQESDRGICKEYPLMDDKGNILWKGKFPDKKALDYLKKTSPSYIDFLREYMLKIVPDGDRIIFPEDIHRYSEDELFPRKAQFCYFMVLIDPAVSLKHTADKTAIITARVYSSKEKLSIYLSTHPINKRMSWPDILKDTERIVNSFDGANYRILVEGGSSQSGLTQMLQEVGLNAEEVTPQGNDKATRLSMTRVYLQNNTILFPEYGTEELELQLLSFGTERYDDLVDALTLIVLKKPNLHSEISPDVVIVDMPISLRDSVYNSVVDKNWAEHEDEQLLNSISKGRWRSLISG